MKKGIKKAIGLLCLLCLTLGTWGASARSAEASGTSAGSAQAEEVTVVFTHDLHSHLDSFSASLNGEEQEVGGFARLKTFIDETRAEDPDTLVVDGGDFSMGTLYQTVFETQAAELRMLGYLGYDATTLGNHEFDYRTEGLTNMLNSASESGDALPAMVVCNVDWEATMEQWEGDAQTLAAVTGLKEAFEGYGGEAVSDPGIREYVMLEKGGVHIAVTGVFGKESFAYAPTCQLVFRDPVEAVKETVAKIEEQEEADLIVCVSHSGTWEDPDKSEDEILAKKVPQLDLIVSGHTHTTLEEPIVHGDTAVVSAGEYGMRAGRIKLSKKDNGRWQIETYELVEMTDAVAENAEALQKIQDFGQTIDSDYLSRFGYTKDQVLAYNPWENPTLEELYGELKETPFTNLLSDAYIDTLNQLPEFAGDPVDVAVVPTGVIRDVFAAESEITVSDVYNVFSLGIGPDGVPGYPLISIYLTGKDLKTAAEVDASISPIMNEAQLYMSGLSYTFNPNRLILNKVTEISLMDREGNQTAIEDDKLYRVVADLYSGQMLGTVSDQSFGILSVTPRDAAGEPVEDLEDFIVYSDGREVKAWEAIARYVEALAAAEGTGEIPEYYNETQGRKILDDDGSLGAILKNPNRIAIALACILLAVLVLLVLLAVLIVKLIKRRRRRRSKRQASEQGG